jgi:hypothetical protein
LRPFANKVGSKWPSAVLWPAFQFGHVVTGGFECQNCTCFASYFVCSPSAARADLFSASSAAVLTEFARLCTPCGLARGTEPFRSGLVVLSSQVNRKLAATLCTVSLIVEHARMSCLHLALMGVGTLICP